MATSNYEETVRKAVANMTGDVVYEDRPRRRVPTVLLNLYFGFLGFGVGVLFGLLTGYPTFFTGFGGVLLAIICVGIIRRLSPDRSAEQAVALNAKAHELEVEAHRLEAEVARQADQFDKWEKKP